MRQDKKNLMSVFLAGIFLCGLMSIYVEEAQARSCKAQQALKNQRCANAKRRPSRPNQKACADATNRYNNCLKGNTKR